MDSAAATTDREPLRIIQLQCPICRTAMPKLDIGALDPLKCSGCGFVIIEVNGILRALSPDRQAHFEKFIHNYQAVRTKEGWGAPTSDYYLDLPFKDRTRKHKWIWRIRARTLRYMQKHVLPEIEAVNPSGCRILDIGAGNGWLSYRLAKRGHRPVAVDLLDDDTDGLGAARHYLAHLSKTFPRFQAEMDHLPFAAGQFDIAIFNAAFHYSCDYEKTLRETMRCLRRPGLVIIADSPFYRYEESGQRMLEERRATFGRRFGVSADSIQSREYVTPKILDELAGQLEIQWSVGRPWYGVNWALRPAKARLLNRREPSKFYLLWFRVGK
jgi:ubiquinone/menaquinone biosynthesis C-methylase UbiE